MSTNAELYRLFNQDLKQVPMININLKTSIIQLCSDSITCISAPYISIAPDSEGDICGVGGTCYNAEYDSCGCGADSFCTFTCCGTAYTLSDALCS